MRTARRTRESLSSGCIGCPSLPRGIPAGGKGLAAQRGGLESPQPEPRRGIAAGMGKGGRPKQQPEDSRQLHLAGPWLLQRGWQREQLPALPSPLPLLRPRRPPPPGSSGPLPSLRPSHRSLDRWDRPGAAETGELAADKGWTPHPHPSPPQPLGKAGVTNSAFGGVVFFPGPCNAAAESQAKGRRMGAPTEARVTLKRATAFPATASPVSHKLWGCPHLGPLHLGGFLVMHLDRKG